MNNGSTDGTTEIAAQYAVRLPHELRTQSTYAARNLGITHSHGDIVAFTDADAAAEAS